MTLQAATIALDRKSIMTRAWELARSFAEQDNRFWHNANAAKLRYPPRGQAAPVYVAPKISTFLASALRMAWKEAREAARLASANPATVAALAEAERELWGANCSDLRGSLRDETLSARAASAMRFN